MGHGRRGTRLFRWIVLEYGPAIAAWATLAARFGLGRATNPRLERPERALEPAPRDDFYVVFYNIFYNVFFQMIPWEKPAVDIARKWGDPTVSLLLLATGVICIAVALWPPPRFLAKVIFLVYMWAP